MKRVQVQFRPDQLERLREEAVARCISVAQVVRDAVDARVDQPDTDDRARALATIGQFRSGCRDVAVQHDEHLAEDFT